jgi:predicted patatin/cPLA2 family phospholipase
MRQLDDGIGDTLVLALKVLGDGRSRCYVTSTRPRHRRRCHRYRPSRSQIDVLSRYGNRLGRTSFREAQYKGVADTIVQLTRRSTSGVIAESQAARERTVETCRKQLGSLTRNMDG